MVFNPIPSWINQVNYVTNIVKNPCGARPGVYVQTAIPALAGLFAVWVEPQVSDVVRGALRPRNTGFRGGRHLRGGRKGRGKGIPEVGTIFGANLAKAAGIRPMIPAGPLAAPLQAASIVWDASEFIGLGLLIVGGSLGALADWTSMVMDASCDPERLGNGPQLHKDVQVILGIIKWQSVTMEILYRGNSAGGWASHPGGLIGRDAGLTVSLSAEVRNNSVFPRRIQAGFWTGPTDEPPQVQGEQVFVPPLGKSTVAVSTTLPNGGRAIGGWSAPDGNLTIIGVDMWAAA